VNETEKEIELARESILKTPHDFQTRRLKVILLQQRIARCLRESPNQVPQLVKELEGLSAEFTSNSEFRHLHYRTQLLKAAADHNQRLAMLIKIAKQFPEPASGIASQTEPILDSLGLCKNGHPLMPFQTPRTGFGKYFCFSWFFHVH
jgi:hypothetical protein